MLIALTRQVSPSITRCELTHLQRAPIDIARAERQHERYEAALQAMGCTVQRLPPEPDLPDSVFVEDTALVFDQCAVIARPGASSRRPEVTSVVTALERYRSLHRIEPPGTLDGGDVLTVGDRVYVGLSTRTNAVAAKQLERVLAPLGYAVEVIAVRRCLHLKSAASALSNGQLLLNPSVLARAPFDRLKGIEVHPAEPFAANVVCIGRQVLCQAGATRTQERLEACGYTIVSVDMSELAKAEGGLTCCSLVFRA
jgi:dimethylargininase